MRPMFGFCSNSPLVNLTENIFSAFILTTFIHLVQWGLVNQIRTYFEITENETPLPVY